MLFPPSLHKYMNLGNLEKHSSNKAKRRNLRYLYGCTVVMSDNSIVATSKSQQFLILLFLEILFGYLSIFINKSAIEDILQFREYPNIEKRRSQGEEPRQESHGSRERISGAYLARTHWHTRINQDLCNTCCRTRTS